MRHPFALPTRLAPLAVVATLALAACGDDDDETDAGEELTEEDFVAVGAEELDLGDPEVDRCITQAAIDAIGFENIAAADLTPEELFDDALSENGLSVPEERVADLQATVAGCGDLIALFAASGEASDAEAACASEHLDNEAMAAVFVSTMTEAQPSPEVAEAFEAMQTCVDAEG